MSTPLSKLKRSLPSFPLPFGSTTSSPLTPPPLSPSRLSSLSVRKDAIAALLVAFTSLHKTAGKKRSTPEGGEPVLPTLWVGIEMVKASEEMGRTNGGEDALDPYGTALRSLGLAHVQLAELTSDYLDKVAAGFLTSLEQRLEDYKELEKAFKEAEKVRAVLEILLIKMQKSKKEKPDLEEELESTQREYDDACQALGRRAAALDGTMGREAKALSELLDSELHYATEYQRVLQSCKASWPPTAAINPRTSTLKAPLATTRMSRSQSDTSTMRRELDLIQARNGVGTCRKVGERRSTISTTTSPVVASSERMTASSTPKNRSRSSSFLSRFGGSNKKASTNDNQDQDQTDDEDSGHASETVGEDDHYNRPSSYSFSRSLSGIPSLPTLSSLKKLGTSTPRYDTLDDSPTSSNPPTTSFSRPSFERTHTAPPSLILHPTPSPQYIAAWSFTSTSPSELSFPKSSVVSFSHALNDDWWYGTIVLDGAGAGGEGKSGLFPSAFVVPYVGSEKRVPPPRPPPRRTSEKSPFEEVVYG